MRKSVKKAISLPVEQDERVKKLTKSEGVSYSKIMQEALKIYLKQRDSMAMEESYARYYGDPKNVKADEEITEWLWELSKDTWRNIE